MASKIAQFFIITILSLLSVFGFYRPTVLLGMILLVSIIVFNMYTDRPTKLSHTQLCYSLLMGMFWLVSTYRHNWTFSPSYITGLIATFILATLSIYKLIDLANQLRISNPHEHKHTIRVGISIFLVITLTWGIYWLAYYPGLLSDDSVNQWSQLYGTLPLSEWHPLIHTFFIKILSVNGQFPGLFLAIQVVFGAATVACILGRSYKLGLSTILVYLIALFYAIYPVNGYYMVTMWKDTPYSILLLILFWLVFEIVHSDERILQSRWFPALLAITLFGVGTVRKNGMLVIVALILCLLIFMAHKKTILMVGIITFALIAGYNTYTTKALNAVKSPPSEALSIPIQQVAATYRDNGNIPKTQRQYFDTIMPKSGWIAHYNPYLVDTIKFSNEFNKEVIDQDPKKFVKNWLTTLKHNPIIFVKAYATQVAAVWEIEAPPVEAFNLHVFRIPYYGERDHAEVAYKQSQDDPKLFHKNMVWQYHIYAQNMRAAHQEKKALSESQYEKNRILQSKTLQDGSLWAVGNKLLNRLFDHFNSLPQQGFTRGGLLTILLLILAYMYAQAVGLKKASLVLCVPVINVLSLAISIPAPQFRYVYSLAFSMLPILLGLILLKKSPTDKPNQHSGNSVLTKA